MAIKITTRITNRGGDCGRLKITVKNNWKFWNYLKVKDNQEVRDYLKSSDFQEFIYQLYSKYEGMDYEQMSDLWDADNEKDNDKIKEKLDRYLWIAPTNTSENDVNIRITKRECLNEGYGMFCDCWFIQGRIYNKDLSRYKSFHYYTSFAPNDVLDLAINGEEMSDEEIDAIEYKFNNNKSYKKKLFNEYIDFDFERFAYLIKSYNDCADFYEALNATIDEYNRRCA